jgi:PAS domain S-box-containing protein
MKFLFKIQHSSEVINEFATNSFRFGWAGIVGALSVLYFNPSRSTWNLTELIEYGLMFSSSLAVDVMSFRFKYSVLKGTQRTWLTLNFILRFFFYLALSLIMSSQIEHFGFLNWSGLLAIATLGTGVESIVSTSSAWPVGASLLMASYVTIPLLTIFLSPIEGGKEFFAVCIIYLMLQIPKMKSRYELFIEQAGVKLKLDRERSFNREILDLVPDPIFTKDENHRWIFANRAFCELLGKPLNEIVGKSDYDFFPVEMADVFWQKDKEVLTSKVPNENEEFAVDRQGKVITILTKKTPVVLSNGIKALIGVIRDITDRKILERSNQTLARRLDLLAKSSHMAVWYANAKDKTFEATAEFYDITGLSRARNTEQIHMDFLTQIGADFLPAYNEKLELFRSGAIDSFFVDCTFNVLGRGPIWARVFLTIEERDPDTKKPASVIGYLQDISQIKHMEERLQAQSRLTALGEMASGIAHEINNPLMIISGRMNLLLRDLLSEKPVNMDSKVESIEKVLQTVERITKIVRGLRLFSRSEDREPFETVDIEILIRDTLSMCEEHFRNGGIELSIQNIPKDKTLVTCRATQISQVLINLLNNAFDAQTDFTPPSLKKWVHLDCEKNDDVLRISVTDNGVGISENIVKKLMQPFFTTKEVGKGTGLGLSISKGIVEGHGGRIWLDRSHPHTKFIFEVPLQQTLKA